MFRIIIALWFFRFFINILTNNALYRAINESYVEELERCNINKMDDISNINSESKFHILFKMILLCIIGLYKFLLIPIDFILMLSMLKYDNTYITLIFIVITIIDIIIRLIKGNAERRQNKTKSVKIVAREDFEKLNNITLYTMICRMVNVLYWGYAIYLLYF